MKKLIVFFMLLFSTALMAQESETRNVGSFKGVKAAEGIDVYLKKSDKESVKVESSGIPVNKVITEVSGDYLKIHLADGRYNRSRTVKVYVTYVDLKGLSASSAANIYSEGVITARV